MNSNTLAQILEACGHAGYLSLFEEHEISITQLPSLSLDDLKEMGVEKLGHRKAIFSAIAEAFASAPLAATTATEIISHVTPNQAEVDAPQNPQTRPKIFLSYGRKDATEVARRLERDLEAAGFEVWMDVKKIGSGSLWLEEIEEGLRESQVVVSLLSPHAVRRAGDTDAMDSVCLDEITFARTSSPPTPVVPAMVAPCEPPFIIYRLDYVHLMGWRDSEEDYRRGVERLVAGIRDALAGKVSYRAWEDRLRPLDFSDYMARKRRAFVGREWLFEEIDLWRFEAEERALLITGDPGAGKSSIVAQLVHANPGGQVIGYHCCQSNELETLRPARFVQSLAAMLASRLPSYAEQLEIPTVKEALTDKRCEVDPGGAFLEGVIQPLHKLPAPEEGVRYLLVDALDEALGHAGNTNIIDILASRLERLPAWLRVVATTRNEPAVIQRLSGLRAKSITASDPRNLEDLGVYVRLRLEDPALAERLIASRTTADVAVEQISRKSAGNFLYAVNALDGIARDFYAFDDLESLPRGLDGLYLEFFRRIFGREGSPTTEAIYAKASPLLQVLASAIEPLSRAELAAASGLDPDEDLPRLLRQLAQLLTPRNRPNGEETIAFYHKSIIDWLVAKPEVNAFAVSRTKGRARLADFARTALATNKAAPCWYVRRHAVEHFLESGDWDSATVALSDLEFIGARAIAQELSAMLGDYAEAMNLLPEGETERQRESARQAELDRYAREMGEYAAAWARIREGSKKTKPPLPRPIESVRIWSAEENAAEIRRITETPNRYDLVKAFRHFIATNSAALETHSQNKGFVANLAQNKAPAGPVHEAGFRLLAPLQDLKLIRQFPSEAIYNPLHPCRAVLEGHTDSIESVALSADGRIAVSGSSDNTLRVWNLESSDCLKVLEGHSDSVTCLALSADGRLAVSGSRDKTLRVWNLSSGKCLKVLEGHFRSVTSLALSADGRCIVSASLDATLRVWDLESSDCLKVLEGHTGSINSIALSADGRLAISGSGDRTLRVWNLESGECIKVLKGHTDDIYSLALSADGRLAISGSRFSTLLLWDLHSGKCLKTLEGHNRSIISVALSDNGRLAVSGSRDSTLRLWNLESGECLKVLEGHTQWVNSVTLSADGRIAISGSSDKTLRVWGLESSECHKIPDGHTNSVISLVLSADGRLVASGSFDNSLRLWNLESSECLKILEGHIDGMTSLALSADGRFAISGGNDTTLRLWDLESGDCIKVLNGHAATVRSIALSADGRHAVSISRDTTLRIWDLESGECLKILEGHGVSASCLALNADGRLAVSGGGSMDKTLRVWRLESGDCLKVLEGHAGGISSLSLSADGRLAVSGSRDKTLRVWDLESGDCIKVLEGHTNSVNSLVLSADGRHAVSSSSDNTLRLWDLDSGVPIAVFFLRGATTFTINWNRRRLAVGFSDGRVEFYQIHNLSLGPLITTAQRDLISEDLPPGPVTARPVCCGQIITIPDNLTERIEHWHLLGHNRGDRAYTDPTLLIDCPNCNTLLRMNPFLVDVKSLTI